jgi:hypothetical protein
MEIRNQNSSFLLELTAKLFTANSFFFLHGILVIVRQQEISVRSTQCTLRYSIPSAGDAVYSRQYSPLVQVEAIAITEDMQT